jgi:hypothetical protein
VVDVDTANVVAVNVTEVAPSGIVTNPGTVTTAGFKLTRITVAPPLGADMSSVTVPNAGVPWTTVVGLRSTELKFADPVTDSLNPAKARRTPTEQRTRPTKMRKPKKTGRETRFVLIRPFVSSRAQAERDLAGGAAMMSTKIANVLLRQRWVASV